MRRAGTLSESRTARGWKTSGFGMVVNVTKQAATYGTMREAVDVRVTLFSGSAVDPVGGPTLFTD